MRQLSNNHHFDRKDMCHLLRENTSKFPPNARCHVLTTTTTTITTTTKSAIRLSLFVHLQKSDRRYIDSKATADASSATVDWAIVSYSKRLPVTAQRRLSLL
jgi:hypothetical protein